MKLGMDDTGAVEEQGKQAMTQSDETSTSRGDANDTIYNFNAESWWGPDADTYLEDWMATVDPLYAQLAEQLEGIGGEIPNQVQQQIDASSS